MSTSRTSTGRTPRSRPGSPGTALTLRVLGELELWRGDRRLELPQSKKTRALLAYLAVSERAQRRDRLCDLLWDVADDPRAALRWSLSKLRPLVDEPDARRLETTGDAVRFEPAGVRVDLFAARALLADPAAVPTAALAELAAEFRGPFLEGLEMPDFLEFQSWALAVREECRTLHARLLATLADRLAHDSPGEALPYARTLAQIEPLDEEAHVRVVRLLAASGRAREADAHVASALRLLRQANPAAGAALRVAQREAGEAAELPAHGGTDARTAAVPDARPPDDDAVELPPLFGRDAERERLVGILADAATTRRLKVVLLLGEPGIGKTRLLDVLTRESRRRGGTALEGRAYEAETSRPYGPWIDALRQLPRGVVGATLAGELAPILPELGAPSGGEPTRDRLFGAVVELLAARAHSAPPVVVAIDDVQWCDDASASLLHFVARMSRHRPVVLALAGRAGELSDNPSMTRVLRGLRREDLVEEIELPPLDVHGVAALVSGLAPAADAARVFATSSGNPLFALEIARSLAAGHDALPPTLRRLVRDRIERLPADAADVLRWAAVVGRAFDATRLGEIARIDAGRLMDVLEELERFAMIRVLPGDRRAGAGYGFAHDVVREVVYAEISEPRRRLMHQRVVDVLGTTGDLLEPRATELAHHAAQAGDAEAAARACLRAARSCLRVFASAEADALARRGAHYAQSLREPDRVELLLEFAEVRHAAQRPQEPEAVSAEVEALARLALSLGRPAHARLGFHLASWLRWEGGNWSDAQRHMLLAEEISRGTAGRERATALGEAARCLALLERDLGHAEALALEAEGISASLESAPSSISDAIGMLRLYDDRLDEAAQRFAAARELCRREQDHLGEFRTLEHQVMLEIRRASWGEARRRADELVEVASRLRDGSEAPFARVLAALARYMDDAAVSGDLAAALDELRSADAKQRLGYALTRAAEADLRRGDAASARARAEEALRLATLLERPSDVALARVALARVATMNGDREAFAGHVAELRGASLRFVSAEARAALASLVTAGPRRAARRR